MTPSTLRAAAAAVALMVAAAAPAQAQAPRRGAVAMADAAIAVDATALRQGSASARQAADALSTLTSRVGTSRVIATLGTIRPEGDLSASERVAQRRAIADRQSRVLSALGARRDTTGRWTGAGVDRVTTFTTVPMVALSVTPEKLSTLLASGDVTQVAQDALHRQTLWDTIPLVEANYVQQQNHKGQGYAVAVLDSGVVTDHPMLAGRAVAEACFNTELGLNLDAGGGYFVDVLSQCAEGTADTAIGPGTGQDCPGDVIGCGHGTHVASTAVGNKVTIFSGRFQRNLDLVGVAPEARLIAINVFTLFRNAGGPAPTDQFCGPGTEVGDACILAFDSDIIEGLDMVAQIQTRTHPIYGNLIGYGTLKGVASANMSLGGGRSFGFCDAQEPTTPIINTLHSLGVATVIAAGNNGWSDSVSSPGCISQAVTVGSSVNEAGVIVFGSTAVDDLSDFTNSSPVVDLWAPGDGVLAAFPPFASATSPGYGYLGGTSMATPHVAGSFAVMREAMDDAGSFTQLNNREKAELILTTLSNRGRPITDPRNRVTRARIDLQNATGFLNPDTALPGDAQTLPLPGSDRARARR